MDPVYFARALSLREAALFLSGLSRRYRAAWEQARMIAKFAAAPHVKDFSDDMLPTFSWEHEDAQEDEDSHSEEREAAELEALRAYALKRDEQILINKQNGKR